MKIRYAFIFGIFITLAACASEPTNDWSPLDLTPHDIPLTIMAPDSAIVHSKNLSGVMRDVTVQSEPDNYTLQILASAAITNDMTRLKNEQLELVRDNHYFERIVREEPQGFIFENRIDSLQMYGFRYIVYQGDKEYIFQNGFSSTLDLESIEAMYQAVQQKP